MKSYTVHHRSLTPAGILNDPDGTVFVKEGAAWFALFFSFFWAFWNRLWLVGVLIFAALTILSAIVQWLHLSYFASFIISNLINLLIALEGNELRRWALEQKGYAMVGIVTAPSLADCERIFFERIVQANDTAPVTQPPPMTPPAQMQTLAAGDDLFPIPGGGP